MAVSKANQRAVNKYKKNNYDRIEITVHKGQRAVFQAHAVTRGESVNGFIGRAIAETMQRDSGGTAPCDGLESTLGAGMASLPPDILEAAERAAEAAGEDMAAFLARAVEAQVRQDEMKGGQTNE